MDPMTLAGTITALLAPYIKEAGKIALDKIPEKLPGAISKIWQGILDRNKEKPSEISTPAIQSFAENPEDPNNEIFLKMSLKTALEQDPTFADQLTDLIKQAKNDPSINIGGDGVVADHNSVAVGNNFQANNNSGTISFGNKSGNN